MTRKEYECKLEELQNQIKELKKVKIEEEIKVWKPKRGETYYLILSDGMIVNSVWFNTSEENESYSIGNCFKTKKEAEFEKEKQIIRTMFKRYLKEHNNEINFGGENFYILAYDIIWERLEIKTMSNSIVNDYIASSKEILEDAVKFIGGEEVTKKYLFDYIGE